jgi:hypothetical protein
MEKEEEITQRNSDGTGTNPKRPEESVLEAALLSGKDSASQAQTLSGGEPGRHLDFRGGNRTRLTPRDRDVLVALALARYLSTEQLRRLFFSSGTDKYQCQRRLKELAGQLSSGPGAAFARALPYRNFDGAIVALWGLTSRGYVAAERVLGRPLAAPGKDVSADYREHCMLTNELFVQLALLALKAGARIAALQFKWAPAESVRLPWTEYNPGAGRRLERLVIPDAVLELPEAKRRVFVECETGTQPIVAVDKRAGATVMKVAAYEAFVGKHTDAERRQTFYQRAYPDGWTPEVLFLVTNEGRKDSVNTALGNVRRSAPPALVSRALTHEEAAREFSEHVRPPGRGEPSTPADAKPGFWISPQEGEAMRDFFNRAVGALGQCSTLLKRHLTEEQLKAMEHSREETKASARRVQQFLQRAAASTSGGAPSHD